MTEESVVSREIVFQKDNPLMTDLSRLSEEALVERIKKGSREAYQVIVTRYMKSAYYIALGLLHNHQDALDVSQDAFIRAYRKRRTFDPDRPFFPWFYRLLRNLCLDYIKKYRRSDEIPLEDAKILDNPKEDKELKQTLRKGLEDLPPDHREIILLRYFRQMSYQEIAEVTGKPIGTVMSSLFYAKKRLKDIMKKYLDMEHETVG